MAAENTEDAAPVAPYARRVRFALSDIRQHCRKIRSFFSKARPKPRMRAKVEDSDPSASIENAKDKGKFALIRRIGTGSVSTCYEAARAGKGNLLVLKIVESDASTSSQHQIRNEIFHLRRLERHPNVVRFIDSFCDAAGRSCVAMEHCEHGSLADFLEHGGQLGHHRVANLSRQIVRGLQHIHRQGIIHRDLKLGNILLTADFYAKITDFGLAATAEECRGAEAKLCGTPNYLAPEVCQRRGYSFASDIWSFGVCLYTLCHGQVPFHVQAVGSRLVPEEVISHTMAKIVAGRFHLSDQVASTDARFALASILLMDPKKRPTIDQLLDFEFLCCSCNPSVCAENESCKYRTTRCAISEPPRLVPWILTCLCDSLVAFRGEVQHLVWVKCWGQVTADSLHYVLSNGRQGVLQRHVKGMRRLDSSGDQAIFHDLLEYTQQLELDLSPFFSSTAPARPDLRRTELCAWHYCSDGTIGFLFDSGAWQVNFIDHVKLLVYRNSVIVITGEQGIHENFANWLYNEHNQSYLRSVREIVQEFGSLVAQEPT